MKKQIFIVSILICLLVSTPVLSETNIGLSMPGVNIPYFSSYVNAWEEAIGELDDVNSIIVDAQWDPATQASHIEDLTASNVDVIIVIAVDTTAIIPALMNASNAGIPMIASNAAPEEAAYEFLEAYTGPADYRQGELVAEMMAEALNNKGNVVILEGAPGTHPAIYRAQGFLDKIEEIAPDISILASQPANWQKSEATSIMENWLLRYGDDIDGVFGQDDTLAMGAAEVIEEEGLTDEITVIGIGGSEAGFRGIRNGLLYGTTIQSPVKDAELALEKAVGIANGNYPDEFFNYIEIPTLTIENIDEYSPTW